MPQERVIGRAFKLRQQRPFVFDGKRDDAARVDRLPSSATRISSRSRKFSAPIASNCPTSAPAAPTCLVINARKSRSRKNESFRSEPPVENNRRRLRHRKERHLVHFQQRREPRRHAQRISRKISLRNNFAEQRDDDCRENKRSYAGKDGIRQQREQHVDRNIAPQHRGQGEVGIFAQSKQSDCIAVAACRLDLQP